MHNKVIKKISQIFLISIILTSSLLAKENKYLKISEYSNWDHRIFVGLNANISYLRNTYNLDRSMYSYGAYIGLPIIFSNELILKSNIKDTNNFQIKEKSIVINFPFTARSSRQGYFGLLYGEGKLSWKDKDVSKLNLNQKIIKDNFYGIHIGKRYKFTRNYYARIELDFIKYNYNTPSDILDINNIYTLGFTYGFEYRF